VTGAADRWAREWEWAWREHDAARVASLYADDAHFRSHPFRDAAVPGDFAATAFESEHPSPDVRFAEPRVAPDGRASVLVIGCATPASDDTEFDWLVRRLADVGVLLAGSSGNRHGAPTYTARDHATAAADLRYDVDLVVRPALPLPRRRWWDAPVSCTAFDLTGEEPVLVRHGSLHPGAFGAALGPCRTAAGIERIRGRQRALAGLVERVAR